jgi:hypothetical protein
VDTSEYRRILLTADYVGIDKKRIALERLFATLTRFEDQLNEPHKSLHTDSATTDKAKIAHLRQALEHIQQHAVIVNPTGYSLSTYWNIAEKALLGSSLL